MRSAARVSLLALAFVLASCGASAREKTIRGTFIGLNAARDGFIAWDADYQKNVVDATGSFEDGKAALAAYRAQREPVIRALAAAYRAVAAAALTSDDATVASAVAAAAEFYQAVQMLTGRDPRPPP